MPAPVDAITHKRLVLVKQLYQKAVIQSASQHSTINRILSVICFDLSVETVLKAIVSSLDSSKSPAVSFQGLIQQSDRLLSPAGYHPVPDKANIQYVHSIRNDAQHKAKYPNESDVSDCRTYVRDFLRNVFLDIWRLDFDSISLTDLVQDSIVRQFLTSAESDLSKENYQLAVQNAAAGLTWGLKHVEKAVVGRLPTYANGIVLKDGFGETASKWDEQKAFRTLKRMQETLLYIALGINYTDYMKYRQLVGDVFFTPKRKPHFRNMKQNITPNEANFVLSYCIDTTVQIEACVGNLETPFGSNRW